MFDSLSTRLQTVFDRLGGRGRLTEENIQEALREVRVALLEADVNFKVVREFIERVRVRAIGQDVLTSLTPAQQVVKVVHGELVELLGGSGHRLSPATAAEQFDQLAVDDLDDLLGGRERGQHILADRPHPHPLDELADDLEVDVRLQESHANLAQGFLDVLLGEASAASETVEDGLQS